MNTETRRSISVDRALRLLADPCRRAILAHLRESDGSTTVTQLADSIADEEGNNRDDSLALALRHVHLPKLAKAGVVEYDSEGDTVHYESNESIEKLHRFVSEEL